MVERARRTVSAARELVRKHRPDYRLISYTAVLVVIGLIIIFAIGPQRANLLNETFGSSLGDSYFILRQAMSVLVAVGAFIAFALFFKFDWILKHSGKILLAGFGASALLALFGNVFHVEAITQCALGACRWFVLPGIGTLQPSEFLKFGVLIFLAGFLAARMRSGEINSRDKTLIPVAAILAVCAFFIVILQKDLGTGVALIAIVASMMTVAGISPRIGAFAAAGLVVLGVVTIVIAPHRMERMMTFLGGDEAATAVDGGAYHITHAKIAIGSGGLFGLGIGNSVQAAGYLPEAINDSVFAILGETFGFLGLVFILGMFYLLLRRILKIMDHLPDERYKLLAAGVFGWIGSHVIINVAAMTGLMPLTGITLPLLSFGGTSMVFIAMILGLVFQASQYTAHRSDLKKGKKDEDSRSRRRVGRTRYAGRRSI